VNQPNNWGAFPGRSSSSSSQPQRERTVQASRKIVVLMGGSRASASALFNQESERGIGASDPRFVGMLDMEMC
jgi:hypothetical protein